MEDHREGLLPGLDVHRDVVGVGAVYEETVDRHRSAVGDRHERSIGPRVWKHNDDDRRASSPQGSREQLRDDVAKLFESKRHLAQASGGNIADDVKVIRLERAPLSSRLTGGKQEDRRRKKKDAPHDVRQRITPVRSVARSAKAVRSARECSVDTARLGVIRVRPRPTASSPRSRAAYLQLPILIV